MDVLRPHGRRGECRRRRAVRSGSRLGRQLQRRLSQHRRRGDVGQPQRAVHRCELPGRRSARREQGVGAHRDLLALPHRGRRRDVDRFHRQPAWHPALRAAHRSAQSGHALRRQPVRSDRLLHSARYAALPRNRGRVQVDRRRHDMERAAPPFTAAPTAERPGRTCCPRMRSTPRRTSSSRRRTARCSIASATTADVRARSAATIAAQRGMWHRFPSMLLPASSPSIRATRIQCGPPRQVSFIRPTAARIGQRSTGPSARRSSPRRCASTRRDACCTSPIPITVSGSWRWSDAAVIPSVARNLVGGRRATRATRSLATLGMTVSYSTRISIRSKRSGMVITSDPSRTLQSFISAPFTVKRVTLARERTVSTSGRVEGR